MYPSLIFHILNAVRIILSIELLKDLSILGKFIVKNVGKYV